MPDTTQTAVEMLSWHAVTSATYHAEGAVHSSNSIYFLTDNVDIFLVDKNFT